MIRITKLFLSNKRLCMLRMFPTCRFYFITTDMDIGCGGEVSLKLTEDIIEQGCHMAVSLLLLHTHKNNKIFSAFF